MRSDAGKCWIKGSEHRDGGVVSAPMPEVVESGKISIGMEVSLALRCRKVLDSGKKASGWRVLLALRC